MFYLFERLAAAADHAQATDIETAVAAQIQRIVSARVLDVGQGELHLLQFGMPNVVDVGSNSDAALDHYARRLRRLIVHYEPRLIEPVVQIKKVANAMAPYQLEVTGRLARNGDAHHFLYALPEH